MGKEDIIKNREKELTDVEGGGMMVYLDRDTCSKLGLSEKSTVDVRELVKDGNLKVEIAASSSGVGIEDLMEFKINHAGWKVTDRYNDGEENYISIRDEDGVAVLLDDNYHIDGELVNNLTVKTPMIDITENPERYRELVSLCEGNPVHITLSDTKGLWQRACSNCSEDSVDEVKQTLVQISNQAQLSAGFEFNANSTQIDIEALKEVIETVKELYGTAIEIIN